MIFHKSIPAEVDMTEQLLSEVKQLVDMINERTKVLADEAIEVNFSTNCERSKSREWQWRLSVRANKKQHLL